MVGRRCVPFGGGRGGVKIGEGVQVSDNSMCTSRPGVVVGWLAVL